MLMNLYNTEQCISLSCDSFNTIRQVVADLMGPQVGSDFKSMQNAARIYDTGRWDRLMPDSYEKFSQRMAWGMRQHILLDQVDVDIIDFLMQKALDESERPHGDLISRNYVESIVKAEFVDLQDGTDEWRTYVNETCENILNKVHNAPTVDVIPNEAGYEMYGKGYLQGYERGNSERAKGEWVFIDILEDDNFPMDKGADIYQCSVCGRRIWTFSKEPTSFYPFCHCGADMRGDKE